MQASSGCWPGPGGWAEDRAPACFSSTAGAVGPSALAAPPERETAMSVTDELLMTADVIGVAVGKLSEVT